MLAALATIRIRLATLAGGLLLFPGSGFAQTMPGTLEVSPAFFNQVWQTEDGLPHNDVHGVLPGADGFLWVGTRRGIVRFDGSRFHSAPGVGRQFSEEVSIWRMNSGSDGRGLIALEGGGVIVQQGETNVQLMVNGEAYAQRVVSLCEDSAGRIWTTALRGEVERVYEGKLKVLGMPAGAGTGPSTLACDTSGVVWLASKNKLGFFRGDEFVVVKDDLIPPLFIARSARGGVWLATGAELCHVTKESGAATVAQFPWPTQDANLRDMIEDRNGALWFGTSRLGLIRYAEGRFQSVSTSHNNILCVTEDRTGNIWVGTQGGGLNRVRARQFTVLNTRLGLPNDSVFSFAEDTAGRVWIATQDGGLSYLSNGIVTSLGTTDGWPHGLPPLSLAADGNGDVWIGTQKAGLIRWHDGEFKHVTRDRGLRIELLNCLLVDRAGRVWAGSLLEALYCLEGDQLKTYTVKDGLPGNGIRCLIEDKRGGVWVGTDEGGLARIGDGGVQAFTHKHWPGDGVRALLATEDGAVWIGTVGSGLVRFKDGEFIQVNSAKGLPDDSIQQLLLDDAGWLWCGTSRGLFRAELQQINAVADGRAAMVAAFSYGRSDGLQGFQFNGDFQPSAIRTRGGKFCFATVKGAVVFQPGALLMNREPPAVTIESVRCNSVSVPMTGNGKLAPGVRQLEFRFTAPDFNAPERVRFRHRLDDVSGDWSLPSADGVAVYTNLSPGSHRFRVMASNADGVWNEKGAGYAFVVEPFLWQTRWFPTAAAGTVMGLAVLMGRWVVLRRMRRRIAVLEQERALERERARIAQDIHDELGANLTSIGWLADRGKKHSEQSATVNGTLENIASTARESLTAMDAIVWALNPRNDSLENFANYISHFANEFFRPTNIRCRTAIPTELPVQSMSTEARHHLFLAFKEALNNVARHAEASEVWIRMDCRADHLWLAVEDNGRGLQVSSAAPGQDGLANIRRRVEALSGTLTVESGATRNEPPTSGEAVQQKGTRLRFLVPLHKLNS